MTDSVRQAAAAVLAGGIIAYPTETVYGLGCLPGNEAALQRLLAIKGRDASKGLILLAANTAQLEPWTAALGSKEWQRISTPGERATSWIVPAAPNLPPPLTGNRPTIAVRITTLDTVHKLCNAIDSAIVSTSANFSGAPPVKTATALSTDLAGKLDYVLVGQCGGDPKPSRVINLESGEVLRQ